MDVHEMLSIGRGMRRPVRSWLTRDLPPVRSVIANRIDVHWQRTFPLITSLPCTIDDCVIVDEERPSLLHANGMRDLSFSGAVGMNFP